MATRGFRRPRAVQQARSLQQRAAAWRRRYTQPVPHGQVKAVSYVTYVKPKGGR